MILAAIVGTIANGIRLQSGMNPIAIRSDDDLNGFKGCAIVSIGSYNVQRKNCAFFVNVQFTQLNDQDEITYESALIRTQHIYRELIFCITSPVHPCMTFVVIVVAH